MFCLHIASLTPPCMCVAVVDVVSNYYFRLDFGTVPTMWYFIVIHFISEKNFCTCSNGEMISAMSFGGGHLEFLISMRNILTFLSCLSKNALVVKTNKTFLLNIGIYYMYSFIQYHKTIEFVYCD